MIKSKENISVAIIEDDDEIRSMLESFINNSPGFSCELVFNNCETAIDKIKKFHPEVVLMDIELPGMKGIEGVKTLKQSMPDTDFIMLTIRDDDDSIFRSLCAGAVGYLLKDTPPAKLLSAINIVRAGGSPISPSVARKITYSFHPTSKSPLSDRETEILQKLCAGHNYAAIADMLFISGHTVRVHIKNIYRKLEVNSRAEAVKKALTQKLL